MDKNSKAIFLLVCVAALLSVPAIQSVYDAKVCLDKYTVGETVYYVDGKLRAVNFVDGPFVGKVLEVGKKEKLFDKAVCEIKVEWKKIHPFGKITAWMKPANISTSLE